MCRPPLPQPGASEHGGGCRVVGTLPVLPRQGQAKTEPGGCFSLSSGARFQPRIYTVKSKIPGRQGLAQRERRCCLDPPAVIMPPNLESSGRALCSAAIRRLFNYSATADCFPLPGSGCQKPAEHQEPRCKAASRRSPLLHPPSIPDAGMHIALGTPNLPHPRCTDLLGQEQTQPGKELPKRVSA